MNTRIVGAFAFGSALLLAAYTFSDFGRPRSPVGDPRVEAVTARAPERTYIPTVDSNNDGVPDWQEVLLNTTPLSVESTSTAPYEPPETLTDQLAVTFFQNYVRNKGYGEFGTSPETLIAATNEQLIAQARDRLYRVDDIVPMSDNSLPQWKAYGNAMALVVLQTPVAPEGRNEISILERAVSTNDPAVLRELDPIINDYKLMKTGFLATPVPSELVKEHLDLVNSVNAVLNDIEAMQLAFDDPLQALLRIQRYQDDVLGLYTAIVNLQTKLRERGVTYDASEPAAQVIIIQ